MKEIEQAVAALEAVHVEIRACFAWDENGDLTHPLSVAHREAMTAAYQKLHPRRRFDWVKARLELPDLNKAHEEVGNAHARALIARRESARAQLRAACESEFVIVPRSEEWLLIETVRGSDYMSQGLSADKYARSSAELIMLKAQGYGLTAEVRLLEVERGVDHYDHNYRYTRFGVFAQTTALGAIILAQKPELPLRETVRILWKSGTNPRVLMPLLPAGYEESVGLDYFGGEVRKEEAK